MKDFGKKDLIAAPFFVLPPFAHPILPDIQSDTPNQVDVYIALQERLSRATKYHCQNARIWSYYPIFWRKTALFLLFRRRGSDILLHDFTGFRKKS